MDQDALREQLLALASGDREGNHPIVEAYLKDEDARGVGALLKQITYRRSGRLLLPPSFCLPVLD
jgi:hypothetical protein